MTENNQAIAIPQISLIALFVTALITAQVTASKVIEIGLPFGLPVTGESIIVPAAVFAYALTFFSSDCYAELYGKQAAQALVNVAFIMNFVLLALVWLAIYAPIFPDSPVGQNEFVQTLGASTGIVMGSLLAYIVSQNWDVIVFHRLKNFSDGDDLWLRNIISTSTSQLIDTVIFISIAFIVFQGLSLEAGIALLIGQYVFKLLIAVLDTPFVYIVVGIIRSNQDG
ncbi:queuosine precursor transporter [Halorutilales archaeon Cl-col2-1]